MIWYGLRKFVTQDSQQEPRNPNEIPMTKIKDRDLHRESTEASRSAEAHTHIQGGQKTKKAQRNRNKTKKSEKKKRNKIHNRSGRWKRITAITRLMVMDG